MEHSPLPRVQIVPLYPGDPGVIGSQGNRVIVYVESTGTSTLEDLFRTARFSRPEQLELLPVILRVIYQSVEPKGAGYRVHFQNSPHVIHQPAVRPFSLLEERKTCVIVSPVGNHITAVVCRSDLRYEGILFIRI